MALGALLLCASCGGDGSEATNPVPPPTGSSTNAIERTTAVGSSTGPEAIAVSDPVVAWVDGVDQNWDTLWPAAEVLVDNGCILLTTPDDTGEPVLTVWPTGTTWDHEASAIVLPDGFVVHEGDVIEVGGGGILFDQSAGNNVDVAGLGVERPREVAGLCRRSPEFAALAARCRRRGRTSVQR